jgi:predicted nucleotidyltransferase
MIVAMATESEVLDAGLAERERVLSHLREQAPHLGSRGITRLCLFGSIARGEAGPKSDVDLLIETDPDSHFSLFDVVELQDELGDALRRRVQFAFRSAMSPWLRDELSEEAISIW